MLGTMVSGCGAKNKGSEPAEEPAEVQQSDSDTDDSASDTVPADVTETADDQDSKQITKENVANLNPYIVTVDRYVQDELGRIDVGYMSVDYVELDEESGALCPNLVKSLNAFNADRKQAFEEYYPNFSEVANEQYEKAFETSHSEGSDAASNGPEPSMDYVSADVFRADNVAMSILTSSVSYWGEKKETTVLYVGTTYDSQTGEKLELSDVVDDPEAYKAAVESELERKYQDVLLDDVDLEEYLGWVLTPEGMMLYFPADYVIGADGRDITLQINLDEHPGIVKERYSVAPDEYVIPFFGDEIFYMEANGDGVEREAVVYSPVGAEGSDIAEEYMTYDIYVNGKQYDRFDEEWFYGYKPYYVRKNNKTFIYVYTSGYERDYISVNRFELNTPICIAKLPATPFMVENIEDSSEEFIYRHIAFTNPSMIDDALSFDRNICGSYKGEEGDGWEVRYWDISNIDGKYYLDYIGEYDYMAAEIELLDETPYQVGDELRYMVKVYPFSGFSFGGEYQGGGQVMYISADLSKACRYISLSAGNPFFYGEQNMLSVEEVNLHGIQDHCEANLSVPEIIGSWRCIVSDSANEYNVYMEFFEDGKVDIVRKTEGYTPMVYRGIYTLNENGGTYTGTIDAEAIGMGTQPCASWILDFDPTSDHPIQIRDEYAGGNPLIYGAGDMVFEKTVSGEYDRFIHPGPWKRTEAVAELYDEYLAVAGMEFAYDFAPEYIDAIHAGALEVSNCSSYYSYGIQDNKAGGEIWIKVMDDVLPSIQVTKDWIRYDLGEGSYIDIYDNRLDAK